MTTPPHQPQHHQSHPDSPPAWPQGEPAHAWPQHPHPNQPTGPGGCAPSPSPAGKSRRGLILTTTAAVVAAAVTAGTIVAYTHHNHTTTTAGGADPTNNSGYASAADTGPVTLITNDPTCTQNTQIMQSLYDEETKGWDQLRNTPTTQWSPQDHTTFTNMATAYNNAATQFATLAKQTPHRIMRELYEQSIAAIHTYTDPNTPNDNATINTAIYANKTRDDICATITHNTATTRQPLAPPMPAPTNPTPPPQNPTNPAGFMPQPDPTCTDLKNAMTDIDNQTQDWINLDANIPATDWTPEQHTINTNAATTFTTYANTLQQLTTATTNPTTADLLTLGALYRHTFANTIPTYTLDDLYLYKTSVSAPLVISYACDAAGWKP